MRSVPVHSLILEMAASAELLMETRPGRIFLLGHLEPVFRSPRSLMASLAGSSEWDAARELAAIGLQAAETEGSRMHQRVFLRAVAELAPVGSSQREWAVAQMGRGG